MLNSAPQIQARQILDIVYPIGIIVEFASNVDPNNIMHGQQWELYGQGKTTVCKDSGTFATLGNSVGSETHTLTVNQMPSHSHGFNNARFDMPRYGDGKDVIKSDGLQNISLSNVDHPNDNHNFWSIGGDNRNYQRLTFTQSVQSKGGSQAHNNIQPSIVVLRYRRIG